MHDWNNIFRDTLISKKMEVYDCNRFLLRPPVVFNTLLQQIPCNLLPCLCHISDKNMISFRKRKIWDANCSSLENCSNASLTEALKHQWKCKSLLQLSCYNALKKERVYFVERKNSFSHFNVSIQILLWLSIISFYER